MTSLRPILALVVAAATLLIATHRVQAQCVVEQIGTLSGASDARRTVAAGGLLFVGNGDAGLRIYLSAPPANPANPALLGTIAVPAFEVAVEGTRVYVTDGTADGTKVHIIDASVPSVPTLLGTIEIAQFKLGNIATSGNIIAVGHDNRASLIDVSDPASPVVLATIPVVIEDLVAINGDTLFTLYSGNGQLESYDISDPANPIFLDSAFAAFDHTGMDIDPTTGHLYAVLNGIFVIVDINDPANMTSTLITDQPWLSNMRDVKVSNRIAAVSSTAPTVLLDLSNPTQPALLGTGPSGGFGSRVAISEGLVYTADLILDARQCATPPLITAQPQSVLADDPASPVTFEVGVNFVESIEWRFNGEPIEDAGPFSGAGTPTLTVQPSLATAGLYQAIITNAQGNVASAVAGLVFLGDQSTTCPGDINHDGIVNTADLGILLGAFGGLCP